MLKAAFTLLALAGAGVSFAACGGVPGNSVATVDGEAINKEEFNHWLTVAAKSAGAENAVVPDPAGDYKACVAAKRKATAAAKGQPKVTDAQSRRSARPSTSSSAAR